MTWRDVSAPLRTVARWATIVQVVGYTLSIAFVYHTTRLLPSGAVTRYRGTAPDAAEAAGVMQFPKPLGEMLLSTHTHVLMMAAIFTVSGLGLALCPWPGERWRRFLIAEPFAAILVSFGAMWLMRFADPRFVWVLFASSTLMAVTYYLQAAITLWSLRAAEAARPGRPGSA